MTEQQFGRLDSLSDRWAELPEPARLLAEEGAVVLGDNELLAQLYHESDLLGWGSEIPFSCFMTCWAKERTPQDFATLVHRFVRRPVSPILVMSGTSPEARMGLRQRLKALLRPEWAKRVAHLNDEEAVIKELWRQKEGSDAVEAPPTLEVVNARLHAAYDRLGVPAELRQESYNCQFCKRDPLMLLLTKEAFGTWAPNRAFAEIQGYDIFRTYSEFSCIDGVVCADDAVWLHDPRRFYMPSPDMTNGDKRTDEFIQLAMKQRKYLDALLDEYERHNPPLIPAGFRSNLTKALLGPRPTAPAQ